MRAALCCREHGLWWGTPITLTGWGDSGLLISLAAEPSEQWLLPFSVVILSHNCVAILPPCPVPLCSPKLCLISLYEIGDIPTFLSYKNSNNYGCVWSCTCIYTFPNKCFTNTADILKRVAVQMWFSLWPWVSISCISTYLMWAQGSGFSKRCLNYHALAKRYEPSAQTPGLHSCMPAVTSPNTACPWFLSRGQAFASLYFSLTKDCSYFTPSWKWRLAD